MLLDLGQHADPKAFLRAVMNADMDLRLRLDAAKALLPYMHKRMTEAGKKDAAHEAARKAGAGKFAAAKPPLSIVR